VRRWRRPAARRSTGLTDEDVAALAELPHVESVTPGLGGSATAFWKERRQDGAIVTAATDDLAAPRRVVAGRFFERGDKEGVVISEYLAYRWGFQDEADVSDLIGQKMRLEISQPPRPGAAQLLALLEV